MDWLKTYIVVQILFQLILHFSVLVVYCLVNFFE